MVFTSNIERLAGSVEQLFDSLTSAFRYAHFRASQTPIGIQTRGPDFETMASLYAPNLGRIFGGDQVGNETRNTFIAAADLRERAAVGSYCSVRNNTANAVMYCRYGSERALVNIGRMSDNIVSAEAGGNTLGTTSLHGVSVRIRLNKADDLPDFTSALGTQLQAVGYGAYQPGQASTSQRCSMNLKMTAQVVLLNLTDASNITLKQGTITVKTGATPNAVRQYTVDRSSWQAVSLG